MPYSACLRRVQRSTTVTPGHSSPSHAIPVPERYRPYETTRFSPHAHDVVHKLLLDVVKCRTWLVRAGSASLTDILPLVSYPVTA